MKIPEKCLTKFKAGSKQWLIFDWFETTDRKTTEIKQKKKQLYFVLKPEKYAGSQEYNISIRNSIGNQRKCEPNHTRYAESEECNKLIKNLLEFGKLTKISVRSSFKYDNKSNLTTDTKKWLHLKI